MAAGTSAAAAIGAFTGIASLGWQVFKFFKEGAVLRVSVAQGMELISQGGTEATNLTSVNVTNVGSQPTTLTHLVVERYAKRYSRLLRRKPLDQGLVPNPGAMKLPHSLAVGDQRIGTMNQDNVDGFLQQGGCLYIGVQHAFGKRPKMVRVKPRGEPLKPYPGISQS